MKLTLSATVGLLGLALASGLNFSTAQAAPVQGWLNWRGPQQNGTSTETGLPATVDPKKPLWTADFPGQSTPVIANGKLYVMGYLGDGPALQEGVICYDAETGKELWRQLYSDFLSDTIYLRYATSSPAVDPETGDVFIQGTQGLLVCFSADGKLLWKHSLMEEFGRLTFPNSRTASPVVDGDLIITRGITANWGGNGPAADRFYAFDKHTGQLVWASNPADRPKDNSFSHPIMSWLDGKRVLYSATGDGAVVCLNARTGDYLWRAPLTKAGINATVLVHNDDSVVSIYGTPYEPGQIVALKIPHGAAGGPAGPLAVQRSKAQIWADDISTSTSSPILVGDRVYVVSEKGDLCCVNVQTGEILWKLKIGIEERNSCPVYADGKLYVPILDDPDVKSEGGEAGTKGGLYIIKPSDKNGEIICHVTVDGRCFGTPTPYNGKIYLQTTRHLYCFGKPGKNAGLPKPAAPEKWPTPGPATQLQIIPSDVLLRPGQAMPFRVRSLDANGLTVEEIKDQKAVQWASFIPPTAKVKATMKGAFNAKGELVAAEDKTPSAGAFQATYQNLKGTMRGRVLPYLPIKQDFESVQITETNVTDNLDALVGLIAATGKVPAAEVAALPDLLMTNAPAALAYLGDQVPPNLLVKFAYPPLPWIGARFKFEIRELNGNKVLAKTLDNPFFQRATVFIGEASSKDYTIEADVMSEGNKRTMSEVGLVNQRYIIVLKGNAKELEVNSTQALFHESVPFEAQPNTWYHLKSRVDVSADGSGVVRAKVWKKSDPEPEKWTIEARHPHVHESGSPGLFALAPQKRVYIDNVVVTPNK